MVKGKGKTVCFFSQVLNTKVGRGRGEEGEGGVNK